MKPTRRVPKSVFKAQALQYFREVELTGEPLVITDRGKPVLRLLPFVEETVEDIFSSLRGAVQQYDQPLQPVGEDDWSALK